MKKIKKSFVLIAIGLFNIIHSATHIIQFIQSVLLVHGSMKEHDHHENLLDKILHNPIISLIWATVAVTTLIIGVKEYFHHKKCN